MNPRFNKEFYLKAFFLSSIIIPQRLNNNCTRYYQSYVIILSSIINNTARNAKLTTHKMQKRYSHFIDNCHAYLKASSPLISFARNANSQLLQRRKECQKKIPPSTTIKPSPPCLFKTITDFTALFLDLPNSTRLDNSNFVFPFDSFVYVRCRDG